jgi:hypothetical protein
LFLCAFIRTCMRVYVAWWVCARNTNNADTRARMWCMEITTIMINACKQLSIHLKARTQSKLFLIGRVVSKEEKQRLRKSAICWKANNKTINSISWKWFEKSFSQYEVIKVRRKKKKNADIDFSFVNQSESVILINN